MLARSATSTALLSVLCSTLLLLACGRSGPGPASARTDAAGEQVAVAIQTFQFQPSPLEIAVGAVVTWTNHDEILHTVTAGVPGAVAEGMNGRLEGKDAAFQFSFSQPGAYPYFCTRHESMRGEVRVC